MVTILKISKILPNEKNPRFIKDHKFKQLVKSIKEFPEMLKIRPIVVDSNFVILGGNMRLRACIEAGLKEVPVIMANQLTEEQKRRFIITDNVGFGEWDWEALANEWDAEELADWGLDIPADWEAEAKAEAREDDYEIPDEIQTDIVLGDLFEIGPHRLLCGDSTTTECWEKLCGDERLDLMITDPPYNVDYTGKTKDSLRIKNDKMSQGDFYQFLYDFYVSGGLFTKQGGAWYIWHADSEGHNFRKAFIDAGFKLSQCLIWKKNSMVMGRQDYHWRHEPCLYGWKEGAAHGWYSDRKQTTVMEFDRPNRNAEHPTMKPVTMIAYQVSNSSKGGDIVGDGFLGSGTTMVAAHQLSRKCYGMELDPKYCQVIVDRMRKLDPDIQIKKNGKLI
jgi:site-specific DNA-methyltransferase (adenine-specific)